MFDPQKERVYEMEHTELGGHAKGRTHPRTLHKLAKDLCAYYSVPVPAIIFGIKGCAGWYDYRTLTIGVSGQHGCNLLTICHEIAHHIAHTKAPRSQPHGATWVRIYGECLALARLVPICGFRAICRRHGVKMGPRKRKGPGNRP